MSLSIAEALGRRRKADHRETIRKVKAAFAAVAILAILLGLIGVAYASPSRVFTSTDTAVAISSSDPTGSANGAGGYSISPTGSQENYTYFWCELDAGANTITGGVVRIWKQTGGTWGRVPELDYTVSNISKARWIGKAKAIRGHGGRVYCQHDVTVSGGGTTLNRIYGFRVER